VCRLSPGAASQGRFYAGRPILAQFCPVTDFKDARCRQFEESTCSRGGYCNFMHLKKVSSKLQRRLLARVEERREDEYRRRRREDRTPPPPPPPPPDHLAQQLATHCRDWRRRHRLAPPFGPHPTSHALTLSRSIPMPCARR